MPARKAKTAKARKPAKRPERKAAKRATRKAARPDLDVPSGWSVEKGGKRMSRELVTKDFLEAVEVISALAHVAEELEHHPDFHLEQWNHLRVTTWSHDVGGLTERDVRLAERVDRELKARGWIR